jgi:hypothetical protein
VALIYGYTQPLNFSLNSFLSVKKWLLRKKHQIELARKRGWKGYWVCLKGTTLLFYPCDSREGRSVEAAPKHLIIVDGAIMQPIPEHPKRDYIFCLSTAFGDAYLFQAPCQVSILIQLSYADLFLNSTRHFTAPTPAPSSISFLPFVKHNRLIDGFVSVRLKNISTRRSKRASIKFRCVFFLRSLHFISRKEMSLMMRGKFLDERERKKFHVYKFFTGGADVRSFMYIISFYPCAIFITTLSAINNVYMYLCIFTGGIGELGQQHSFCLRCSICTSSR